ncbi:DUF58 domain-containing protein [Nocardia aurantia]|uniref:DUF58 domain-containing protein n=1 Tax=Nocardia aurantia TaxID=2585199 RepID=A0A7K0DMQ2_9NOCA|nr:DUF58 domain-containing protein [Nocardia aurantia]MQY26979.1 hypothetical protein [Nocardia aurantia]
MVVTGRTAALAAAAALIVMLAAPSPAGVLVATALLLALIAADALTAGRAAQLELSRPALTVVRAGRETEVTVTVVNTGARTIRGRLWDDWPAGAHARPVAAHRLRLPPNTKVRITTRLTPAQRGDRVAGPITLRLIGPLGLAGRQVRRTVPARVRALPPFRSERILVSKVKQVQHLEGRNVVNMRGQGSEFDSFREYVAGDDVRAIDWRATARAADVLVRTWRPERNRHVLMVLDTGRASAGRVNGTPTVRTGSHPAGRVGGTGSGHSPGTAEGFAGNTTRNGTAAGRAENTAAGRADDTAASRTGNTASGHAETTAQGRTGDSAGGTGDPAAGRADGYGYRLEPTGTDGTRLDANIEAALLLGGLAAAAGDTVDLIAYDRSVRAEVRNAAGRGVQPKLMHALSGVVPALVDTDTGGLVRTAIRYARRRSLVVWFTSLDGALVEENLLPVLPVLTARHRVLLVSVTDAELAAAAGARSTAAEVFTAAAAESVLAERALVRETLRRRGVGVIAATADRLPGLLGDEYLELKQSGAV